MVHRLNKDYFHKGVDLTDVNLYRFARKRFGEASILPNAAYWSKNFSDLEDEKLWTRSWVAIGSLAQIPNPGDLLPFTVGNHGIHVQRNTDGSLSGRFNKAQHGGCRAIPLQCQTGKKTKCSYTSCGHSRDRVMIESAEMGENTPAMQHYIGLTPERLLPVKVETLGPFIFVNLDPDSPSLDDSFAGLSEQLKPYLQLPLTLVSHEWVEYACNWKLFSRAFMKNTVYKHDADEYTAGSDAPVPQQTSINEYYRASISLTDEPLDFVAASQLPRIVSLGDSTDDSVKFCCAFPNFHLCMTATHIAFVISQPSSMNESIQRIFLLYANNESSGTGNNVNQDSLDVQSETARRLCMSWGDYFRTKVVEAEQLQTEIDACCAADSRPVSDCDELLETSYGAYLFQQHLINRLLYKHEYFDNTSLYAYQPLSEGQHN